MVIMLNIINDTSAETLDISIVLTALGSPSLLCLLGNRMFFNLKEAAEHRVNVRTDFGSYTLSGMEFSLPEHRTHA